MAWVWRNFLPLVCIIVAGYGCVTKAEGWGWFLFVAVLGAVRPATVDETQQKQED